MKVLRFVYIISIFLATSCAKDIVDLTGDIKGTVKDYKTGELISNCGVSLSPGGKSTSTNQYGEFSFNDLEAGDYTLSFSKSGYDDETKDVAVVAGQVSSTSVMLQKSSSKVGSIIGCVKDYNDARLISNCQVSLSPGGKTYTTSSDGKYEFNGLTPGEYSLSFSKSGYTEDSKSVTVKAGEETTADCLLKAKSSFSLSETSYDFGDLEDNKTFYCYNNSSSDCSYSISNIPKWLTFSKTEGTVKYDSNDSFTVTVDRTKVGEGAYTQTVNVAFSGKSSGTVTLKLSMKKVVITTPTVKTGNSASNITQNSFDISGTIVATGGAQIIEYGHCWSTSPSPTVNDKRTNLGITSVLGSYVSNVTGLTVNTTYYVRAYAKNSQGISYSEQITVTTQDTESDKWDGTKASSFAGGSGTSVDPYQIKTGSQLVLIKDYTNKCFILCNNIDLNNLSWPGFDFSGTLDGNGCTISNLKITRTEDNLGLFSKVTGAIKSLTINGVNIQSGNSNNIGAIAGTLWSKGTIINCTVYLNTQSKILGDSNVGGVIGYYGYENNDYDMSISNNRVISNSSSNVILGNNQVGGIVGFLRHSHNMTIDNCHVDANISGGSFIGGICGGGSHSYDYITNCSYKGTLSGDSKVAGIYGGDTPRSYGSGDITLSGCKADVVLKVSDNYSGGIYGYARGYIRVYGSYATGSLSCDNSNAKYLGGIGGFTDFDDSEQQVLCYSTITSSHANYGGLCGNSDLRAKDCATIYADKNSRLTNCNTSCNDITDFLRSCYSEYSSYFNFNNTWTWTGTVKGAQKSVNCPKLNWE